MPVALPQTARQTTTPPNFVAACAVRWARNFADHVTSSDGWMRAGIAVTVGALSVLSLAPFFAWPVLFVTFPVLVFLIDGAHSGPRPIKRSFLAGWWFGFGYFAAGLFWIGEAFLVEAKTFAWMLPFAVTLLPAGMALFWGLAAAGAERFWTAGLSRVVALAVTLGLAEWVRGHFLTGFPWNVIGYSLTSSDALMQSAGLVGIYSLSIWAFLIFASPLVLLAGIGLGNERLKAIVSRLAVSAVPLIAATAFGAWRLSLPAIPDVEGVKLRIVQPSVVQREKWLPEKQGEIFKLHLDLSRQNARGEIDNLNGVTHVIWPEAAMPFRPLDHPEALSAIQSLLGSSTYLFAGGLRVAAARGTSATDPSEPLKAYNSLMVFGPGGGLAALYDKIHLVPFGEYLPWQPFLEAIGLQQLTHMRGGFTSGETPRPLLSVAALPPVAVLICYEAIFPDEVVQGVGRPGVILNVTNDGWFGNSTGPRQHFHQTRVRAVEQGVPVIRAGNNGISAIIDGRGRMLQSLALNVRGVIDSSLPSAEPVTPYGRYGNLLFLANLLMFGCTAALLSRTRKP